MMIDSQPRSQDAPAAKTRPLQDPATTPKARVTYSASWPDAIARKQASAGYGSNGGTALTRPKTIPVRSDDCLVTSSSYNSAGNHLDTTDPAGMVTRFQYDDVGRQTAQILNYQPNASSSSSSSSSSSGGCELSADTNVTTLTSYNADGNVASLTAVNSSTGNQVTQYVYGTTLADSDIASSTLKRKEIYPDSVDEDDVIHFAYNRQSETIYVNDQAGTVHRFDYDLLGRQTQDRVTSLGTGVDGTIRRIETTFEVRGMKEHLTSFDNATVGSGTVVNDCQFEYNDFGQVITEYQSHDGLVDTGATPQVQYRYANGSDNTIRQTQLIYPNDRELNYDYGEADSIDEASSRVASLIDDDGTSHLVDYSYLGPQTFVIADYREPETRYTLIGTAGESDPDTGDIYRGLDRFGRIIDSYWYHYGDSTDTDRIKYGYDRSGNRIWRENVVATAEGKEFDELYIYDQIHRLEHMDRGILNAAKSALSSKRFAQCWRLDETGNWECFHEDTNGNGVWNLVQSRTSNPVNEISEISESVGVPWVSPVYTRNGNLATMSKPAAPPSSYSASYDAWNRLVRISEGANIVSECFYDGAKRRTIQTTFASGTSFETRHLYYTEPSFWQVVEERLGMSPNSTSPTRQYTWGLRAVDDHAFREDCIDDPEATNIRIYALQDSNWNVTGVISVAGVILQRMVYAAYGQPMFLSTTWIPQQDEFDSTILFAGYMFEPRTELYHVRHRALHSTLGAWVQRDPLGQLDNDNLYAYSQLNPVTFLDPSGLIVGAQSKGYCCARRLPLSPWCVCIDWEIDAGAEVSCCKNGVLNIAAEFKVCITVGFYLCESKNLAFRFNPFKMHECRATPALKRGGVSWVATAKVGSCPPDGCTGRVCAQASIGYAAATFGIRVCFGAEGYSAEIGYGVGTGTGIGGGGCINCTGNVI